MMWLKRGVVVLGALFALGMTAVGSGAAASAQEPRDSGERRTYTGEIDGAKYRVVVPERWNRTLVLYSHGYYPEGFPIPDEVALSNHRQTAEWLLDHGYALAASDYKGRYGLLIEQARTDQAALLDWFDDKIGKPRRTIASGQSMGGVISTLLTERNPERFDGAANLCADYDYVGYFNVQLDLTFAIKTLLAPGKDIELVHPKDPEGSARALTEAIEDALKTKKGRARLALTGALGNVADWYSTYDPKPTKLAERIRQQAQWVGGAYFLRAEVEGFFGGNPSWNAGVDYGRQLARSTKKDLVHEAYRAAEIDVREDLAKLAKAPRISADGAAVKRLDRHGVMRGTTPDPMITLHNTGDAGAYVEGTRWYAAMVRRHGDPSNLRQVYVNRGSHCAFTAAEEIVTLRTLFERVETGKWPSTTPASMNKAARAFGDPYQIPVDFLTGKEQVVTPAFIDYTPGMFPRPSR